MPSHLVHSLLSGALHARRRQQAHHDYHIFQAMRARVARRRGPLEGLRVLDVGCGRTYPFTLLLHSMGACVTGIDIEPVPRNLWAWWGVLREEGVGALRHHLATRLLLDGPYHRELGRVADFPLTTRGLDLRQMDAAALAFANDTFDLAVSNAAFEHFPDVPGVLAELRRVLKPDGLLHVEIHLFPSLTGGHNVPYIPGAESVELGDVRPWDHLREDRHPLPVYLNELREHEYREMFEREFHVLEWEKEFEEPDHLLTPELEAELGAAGYAREELLTRSVVVLAEPRPA